MSATCGATCPPTAVAAGSSARCARSSSGGSTTSNCMLTSTQVRALCPPPPTPAQPPARSPNFVSFPLPIPLCPLSHLSPALFSLPLHFLPHSFLISFLATYQAALSSEQGVPTNTRVEMYLWRLVGRPLALTQQLTRTILSPLAWGGGAVLPAKFPPTPGQNPPPWFPS